MAGYQEITTPSGVVVKVGRFEEQEVIDIRGRDGDLVFMGTIPIGSWSKLKQAIAAAEKVMVQAGCLERNECGSLLQLVKSE